MVGIEASSEIDTWSGFKITSPKGKIVWVGSPVFIVLTCKVTGRLFVDLDWK